jgi:hypothetical protein
VALFEERGQPFFNIHTPALAETVEGLVESKEEVAYHFGEITNAHSNSNLSLTTAPTYSRWESMQMFTGWREKGSEAVQREAPAKAATKADRISVAVTVQPGSRVSVQFRWHASVERDSNEAHCLLWLRGLFGAFLTVGACSRTER